MSGDLCQAEQMIAMFAGIVLAWMLLVLPEQTKFESLAVYQQTLPLD